MQRLKTAQPKPGLLSAGVNSVFEIQTMSQSGLTDSTRPATTVASQISQFQLREGAVDVKPFATFYTNSEPSENTKIFERVNKFSAKSNYLSYIPTKNNIDEKIMEAAWF